MFYYFCKDITTTCSHFTKIQGHTNTLLFMAHAGNRLCADSFSLQWGRIKRSKDGFIKVSERKSIYKTMLNISRSYGGWLVFPELKIKAQAKLPLLTTHLISITRQAKYPEPVVKAALAVSRNYIHTRLKLHTNLQFFSPGQLLQCSKKEFDPRLEKSV